MKITPILFLLPIALCAAPVGNEKAPVMTYKAASGNWNKASNWSGKELPTKEYYAAILNSDPVVIDSQIPPVSDISIGGDTPKPATLRIEKGAKISLQGAMRIPSWFRKNPVGNLVMTGGELETGMDENLLAGLRVGTGATYSGQGYATVSGGIIRGSVRVGSPLPKTQTGTLSVVGGNASISGEGAARNYLVVTQAGTLVFFPNETGLTAFNYDKSRIIFETGAHVIADGSQYKGGSRRFVLCSSLKLDDRGAVLETRNFPKNCEATIKPEKNKTGVELVLSVVEKK